MSYYPSYVSGDFKALCMRCGRLFKGSQLKQTWDGLWVCKEDWEPKHTQLLVTGVKDDQRPPFVFHSTDDLTLANASIRDTIPGFGSNLNNGSGQA